MNQATRPSRTAWIIVILLFFGSVVNYIDRAVLGVVMPQVRKDLDLSNAEYGLAVNAFLVMYAIFYVTGGRVADWLGYRRMFSITLVFWSVVSMLHAGVRGVVSLCALRGVLGIAEGGYYPTAMKGASEWFPPADRAKGVGLIVCGVSVGTLIAQPLVAWIALTWDWRMAFLLTGAMGFLLLPPWWWIHRRARAEGHESYAAAAARTAPVDPDEPTLGEVLRTRKYWCILASRMLPDTAWYFYLFWIPGYFQEVRGFGLDMVAYLLWVPYFASNVGAAVSAWASSALIRRGYSVNTARKSALVPAAIFSMSGALSYFVAGPYVALALVSLALFGHQGWSSNVHTIITEISPPKHVAVLYGLTGASGTMLGALMQPVIGWLVDVSGYAPAFVYAGAVYIAAIGLLFAAGKVERIRKPGAAGTLYPANTSISGS
ncbi:MAG: MFS transporter [Bryobacteraceae bacterium]|nr:MFS transporter [Bryobacteraceae bacterium]